MEEGFGRTCDCDLSYHHGTVYCSTCPDRKIEPYVLEDNGDFYTRVYVDENNFIVTGGADIVGRVYSKEELEMYYELVEE